MPGSKTQSILIQTTHNSVRTKLNCRQDKYKVSFVQNETFEQQSQKKNTTLYRRFSNFLLNQKFLKISEALKKHYGRNYPIKYKSSYGFQQYWQDNKHKVQQSNIIEYFQFPHFLYYIVAFIILISKVGLIWYTSVHRIFQLYLNIQYVLIWSISTIIIDGLLHYKLLNSYQIFKQQSVFYHLKLFWKDQILLIYYISSFIHFERGQNFLLIFDFTATILLFFRCQQIARYFKLQITSKNYKSLLNMSQLFAKILPLSHVFALCLFLITSLNQQKNWMSVKGLKDLQPIQNYVYSLYFTFTTMLTVGYGDFSPVNISQMILIMIIQLLGILTYGYIVNQIGHIIGSMRKEQQILSTDILTISKMAKYYDLDKCLVSKAKDFLICRRAQTSCLTGQEQEKTLSKLNDQLRQEIRLQNSLKVIKSSLFYVCNWTKRFHNEIAKKLNKKIFSPNEQIIQIPGKEKIYIFKKGKVQIHANRSSGYKKLFKKILRTIQANQSMQVSDNIFGYSFIMSNTPIKLTAINKQFVVAYYVQKKDFLSTVMNNALDIEYYNEMKTNIDLNNYPQSWQAPLIINSKQHYFPGVQFLIKKNKHRFNKSKNIRNSSSKQYLRQKPRSKRLFYKSIEQFQDSILSQNIQSKVLIDYAISMYQNNQSQSQSPNRSNQTKSIDHLRQSSFLQFLNLQKFKKQDLHCMFQQGKQFSIYFKRSNKSFVLKKLQNQNYQNGQNIMVKTKKSFKSFKSIKMRQRV